MIIAFNTGRMYTEKGQRIAATLLLENGGLLFVDIDRGIQAFVPAGRLPDGFSLTKADVMQVYDYQPKDWNSMEPFRHARVVRALWEAAKGVVG
jgi:hypothetical protein